MKRERERERSTRVKSVDGRKVVTDMVSEDPDFIERRPLCPCKYRKPEVKSFRPSVVSKRKVLKRRVLINLLGVYLSLIHI